MNLKEIAETFEKISISLPYTGLGFNDLVAKKIFDSSLKKEGTIFGGIELFSSPLIPENRILVMNGKEIVTVWNIGEDKNVIGDRQRMSGENTNGF